MNNQLTVNAVYYNSQWNDRQARKYAQNADGTSIVANLEGLDQLHTGFEVEVAYQPMPLLRVDAALGIGNWTYTDDVKASYYHQHFANHITPHNQYLYVWFEIGIFGLISLILIFYYQIKELLKKRDGIHRILLPLSFMFLMIVDSYLFIFTLTITYIFLYTIYNRFECE